MKTNSEQLIYTVYENAGELNPEDAALLTLAREATATSYAPYSRYHVGAAVKLANGTLFKGSNQENISFPAGLCAERVAIFAAMASFPEETVEVVAISATADDFEVDEPVPPCGICRQAMLEYEMKSGKTIRLILGGEKGKVFVIEGVRQLLPLAFMEKGLIK